MDIIARPVVQQLAGRQSTTYRGGWPRGFIGSSCDGDAPVKCQPYSFYNLNCCPAEQTCSTGWPLYCCPTEEDCGTVVMNLPVCANSTWNMYESERSGGTFYFCCPQGMVGIIPSEGSSGICQENMANIPTTLLATIASQFGGTAIKTGAAGAPTGSTGGGNDGSGPNINTPDGGGDDTSSGSGSGGSSGSSGSNDSPTGEGAGGSNTSSGESGGGGGGGGISAGAIAGIVIGSLAFFTAAIALVLWIHRRSMRRNPPGASLMQYMPPPPGEPPKPAAPGVAQVHPVMVGDAPLVAQQYPGSGSSGPAIPIFTAPQHTPVATTTATSTPIYEGGFIHSETPPPQDAPAPAYSPPQPQHVSEVEARLSSRVAEMEVPPPRA